MKVIGIILSGGSGTRFGTALPKQFAKLAGRSVIEYTVDVFQKSKDIDEIIIVSKAEYISKTQELALQNKWSKLTKIIAGGDTRFMSTYSALQSLESCPDGTKVLFHDSVRPLVTDKIISDTTLALDKFDAVDVVLPSADTLVQVNDDGCISNIPDRSHMRRGQTPQGFKLQIIREAYALAIAKSKFEFTCDCGVVRSMTPHIRVATVDGAERNMKITQQIDLFISEKLLQNGDSQDLQKSDLTSLSKKVIVIFGGSSGIGLAIKNLALQYGAIVETCSRTENNIDVQSREDVKRYLAEINERHQKIDAVINTTGVLIKTPLTLMKDVDIRSIIDTNLYGSINVALESQPYLHKSWGVLLNFTSSSYSRGRAFYSLYSSTKAAIVNFTQALAEEWSSDGIRVNCMNPERTATPMRVANFGVEPTNTLLKAEEVAEASLAAIVSDQTGMIFDVKRIGFIYEKSR